MVGLSGPQPCKLRTFSDPDLSWTLFQSCLYLMRALVPRPQSKTNQSPNPPFVPMAASCSSVGVPFSAVCSSPIFRGWPNTLLLVCHVLAFQDRPFFRGFSTKLPFLKLPPPSLQARFFTTFAADGVCGDLSPNFARVWIENPCPREWCDRSRARRACNKQPFHIPFFPLGISLSPSEPFYFHVYPSGRVFERPFPFTLPDPLFALPKFSPCFQTPPMWFARHHPPCSVCVGRPPPLTQSP